MKYSKLVYQNRKKSSQTKKYAPVTHILQFLVFLLRGVLLASFVWESRNNIFVLFTSQFQLFLFSYVWICFRCLCKCMCLCVCVLSVVVNFIFTALSCCLVYGHHLRMDIKMETKKNYTRLNRNKTLQTELQANKTIIKMELKTNDPELKI